MRRAIALVAALAVLAIPQVAGAADGYGTAIQDCFGATYGQAKNAAWEAGHASKPALGAKRTALAHGCVD